MEKITASFLFADVKGYSQLTEYQIRCFYEEVLPDLKRRFEPYQDQAILKDLNTWGDGLMIYALDPYSLARLALDIRDFYNDYNWNNKGMPKLVVRISLHHGVIYKGYDPLREREGVIGTEITLGARLEPVTDPGQVWVTEDFRRLIKEKIDDSIQFDDLDMRELAKNAGTIHVYKLRRARESEESPK